MKKFVIIGVVLLVSLSLIYIPSMASINLIGNEEVYLNVNDTYFENGYKTEFLISDLDDKVIITDNINNQKVGSYQVKYTLDWFGRNIQKIRKVNVVDNEAPVIKLQGDSTIYIDQNEKYVEYGYVVYDNVDRQLSKDVIIKSNVDTNKIGKYEILYTITDLSGNTASVTRTVEVVNSNILSAPPKDFWLEGMYEDIILKPKEEYDYLDDMIILGDSNIRYLYKHGNYLGANQVWGKDNLNAVELSTAKVIIHETNEEMLVDEYYIPVEYLDEKQDEYDLQLSNAQDIYEVREVVDNILNLYRSDDSIKLISIN